MSRHKCTDPLISFLVGLVSDLTKIYMNVLKNRSIGLICQKISNILQNMVKYLEILSDRFYEMMRNIISGQLV